MNRAAVVTAMLAAATRITAADPAESHGAVGAGIEILADGRATLSGGMITASSRGRSWRVIGEVGFGGLIATVADLGSYASIAAAGRLLPYTLSHWDDSWMALIVVDAGVGVRHEWSPVGASVDRSYGLVDLGLYGGGSSRGHGGRLDLLARVEVSPSPVLDDVAATCRGRCPPTHTTDVAIGGVMVLELW